MAISVDQMHTHLDAARSAIESGDYATAEVQALAAQACLAGFPNTEHDDVITNFRETVNSLLKNIRSIRSRGGTTGGSVIHHSFENFRRY